MNRKTIAGLLLFVISCLLLIACSGPQRGLFASRTPHEKYADKLNSAGLDKTALGRSWLSVANKVLAQPLSVILPYRETGYFPATKPEAAGFRFTVRRGDQLIVQLSKKPLQGFTLFLELWQSQPNDKPNLLKAADSADAALIFEIKKDGEYLLRLQPELLAGGEYTLIVRTAPSLAFPVKTTAHPRIGSFWGDARDAGARSHEGIDIFGKFRTPVVAAADGVIRSAGTNNLGGKVVFMRPDKKDYVLYYAHLDSQLVQQGQEVRAGDIIGLMGNTGNARNTPTHLHFGIYTSGGPVDPLPFVKRNRPEPAAITASVNLLDDFVRSEANAIIYMSPGKQSEKIALPETATLLQVKSATGAYYKVQLPDGREGFIAGAAVNAIEKPLRNYAVPSLRSLYDRPDSTAAAKAIIDKDESVQVLGVFNKYYYVKNDNETGWIVK